MCMNVIYLYYIVYSLTDDGFLRLENKEIPQISSDILLWIV